MPTGFNRLSNLRTTVSATPAKSQSEVSQEVAQEEQEVLRQVANTQAATSNRVGGVVSNQSQLQAPRIITYPNIPSLLTNPFQYLQRKEFNPEEQEQDEDFQSLVSSLRTYGYLGGIIATEIDGNDYIISGHRRRDAINYLHRTENFPASGRITLVTLTEEAMVGFLVNSNTTQKSISPLKLMETIRYFNEPDPAKPNKKVYSVRELPSVIGVSKATIQKYLVLAKMPDEVKQAVESGEMSINQVMELHRNNAFETKKITTANITEIAASDGDDIETIISSNNQPMTSPISSVVDDTTEQEASAHSEYTAKLNDEKKSSNSLRAEQPLRDSLRFSKESNSSSAKALVTNATLTKALKSVELHISKALVELDNLEVGTTINERWADRLGELISQLEEKVQNLQ